MRITHDRDATKSSTPPVAPVQTPPAPPGPLQSPDPQLDPVLNTALDYMIDEVIEPQAIAPPAAPRMIELLARNVGVGLNLCGGRFSVAVHPPTDGRPGSAVVSVSVEMPDEFAKPPHVYAVQRLTPAELARLASHLYAAAVAAGHQDGRSPGANA